MEKHKNQFYNLDWILSLISDFCHDFLNLLTSPKTFVIDKNIDNKYLKDSIIFFALTYLINSSLFILNYISEFNTIKIALFIFSTFVLFFISIIIFSLIIYGSFRCVRKLNWHVGFIITSFYFVAITSTIFNLFSLIGESIIKKYDPPLFQEIINFFHKDSHNIDHAITMNYLLNSGPYRIFICFFLTGCLISSIWFTSGWGAFSKLANVSKSYSALAFLIFGIFFLMMFFLYWITFIGLNPIRLLLL